MAIIKNYTNFLKRNSEGAYGGLIYVLLMVAYQIITIFKEGAYDYIFAPIIFVVDIFQSIFPSLISIILSIFVFAGIGAYIQQLIRGRR